jgi:hypothetical protein
MKSLKEMMRGDNNLMDCEELIKSEFDSISSDENTLKRAVLLLFYAENAMEQLKGIDTNQFVPQVQEKAQFVINEYEDLKSKAEMHIKKNQETLKYLESVSPSGAKSPIVRSKIQELIKGASDLIDKSDRKLRKILELRDELNLEDLVSKQDME